MAKKTQSAFFCQNCGTQSPKWLGKCPNCNEWNSFVEENITKEKKLTYKNALLKITNSLMINTAVNKGALNSQQNINDTSIAKISTNMENVEKSINSIKETNFGTG